MRFAALISGGKDSCFNLMTCVAEGHEPVALANLRPENKDELDSYMYQTVGHHAIDLYAEALDLPLYVATIKGSSLSVGRDYLPHEGDEVEDLFQLLSRVKAEQLIEAVSVGAILSDYQRVRVENVCQRLGLKVLAFLWRRNQEELLKEMIDSGLKAIIIKVAALGLLPKKHLGMELGEIFPHMLKMREKYGLNECGEGGEYETFVFDCPLFKKSIAIGETELVIHSNDAFAPVGYLNLKHCCLQDKPGHDVKSFMKNLDQLPLLTTPKWIAKHKVDGEDQVTTVSVCDKVTCGEDSDIPPSFGTDGTFFQVAGIKATLKSHSDISSAVENAMSFLQGCVEKMGHSISDLTSVSVYIQDMSAYAQMNAVYIKYFGLNPPTRICIQVCLPPSVIFQLDCEGIKDNGSESERKTMHVQSLSHWAPANIGPFSQALLSRKKLFVSGTVALVPSDSSLMPGGPAVQCRVGLIHVIEKLEALWSSCTLAHCPLVSCFVAREDIIPIARKTFQLFLEKAKEKLSDSARLSPVVQYCVISRMPKGACVEWQTYAWIFSDSDEESISSVHTAKEFSCYTMSITHTKLQEHFSCKIDVDSKQPDVDVNQLACDLLREYRDLVPDSHSPRKHLAKIFYPADKFSQRELHESFSQAVSDFKDKIPTFSFIPVFSLETKRQILSWCQ